MARKHFKKNGFPNFPLIVNSIRNFVESLTIEKGTERGYIDLVNPLNTPYTDKYVYCYARPINPDIERGSKPIKVNGIYVVGSQAQRLPHNYKTESDLDIRVQTNIADIVTEPKIIWHKILYQLGKMLNYGRADCRNRGFAERHYAIDLYEEGNPPKERIDAPHLQLYPVIRKVNAVEISLNKKDLEKLLK